MEHFSNEQNQTSLMDSVYLPDSPAYIPFNLQGKPDELSNEFFCFSSYYYQHELNPHCSSSSLTETLSTTKMKPEDVSEKKRKQSYVGCLTTAQSKSKSKRMKKSSSGGKEMVEQQPPTDYIHVRARRGQATDSHSLAERVRRERISERMKILQGLVPGCDKVTGKALVLDEIINYVESLKNQVEFLSMKLASVDPVLCELGLNFDDFSSTPERVGSKPELLPCNVQSCHIQSPGDSFTVMVSSSTPVTYVPGPTVFPQEAGSFFMHVGGQNKVLDQQAELSNISASFL